MKSWMERLGLMLAMLAMLLMSAVPAMASHDGECDDWDWDADEEEWVCVDEDDDGDDGDDEDFDDEDFEGIELADFDLEVVCFLDADFDGLSDEDWADGWDNDWDGEIDEDDIDCFVTAD